MGVAPNREFVAGVGVEVPKVLFVLPNILGLAGCWPNALEVEGELNNELLPKLLVGCGAVVPKGLLFAGSMEERYT